MWYKQTYYKKENGKWKKESEKNIEANMTYGHWVQSSDLDKKAGYKTYLVVEPTRTGLNKKVVKATTYFPKGRRKVKYDLITTSKRLPKSVLNKKEKKK